MATKKTTTAEVEDVAEVAETTTEVEEVTADTILAEARAEAARIIAEAQAQAQPKTEDAVGNGAKPKANGKRKKETVPIRLFKDSEKYSDDVFVAVNGKRVMIRRGETVQVEKKFFKVLEQSADQDSATADLIQRESSSYETEAKRRGL